MRDSQLIMSLLSRVVATALCLHAFLCVVHCSEEEKVPVLVNRRLTENDIVTYVTTVENFDKQRETCDNHTYIVSERRCVNNQDLLNGMPL